MRSEPAATRVFNLQAAVVVEKFDERHCCLIIDDAVLEPEKLAQYALERRGEFSAVNANYYPGIQLPAPRELSAGLVDYFLWRVRHHFDARRGVEALCRYAMVTQSPQALQPLQWICHRDDSGLDARHSMQASVLYLFRDQALGGTNFYAPTRPQAEIDALFVAARQQSAAAFAARYGIEAGYISTGNEYFRLLGNVAAKWNRLIFYDGGMLHSSAITAPERLSDDPLRGRLTLNGFFTSRRNLK